MPLGRHLGFGESEYIAPYPRVHPTARVDAAARVVDSDVGARSVIWQFASVVRGARIGNDCSIASCAIVDGSRLGDGVRVSHGAFIDPGIVISNDVFIGPHVSLCNDAWPRTDKNGFEMAAFLSGEFVTTRIEEGASIGANVVVLPGMTIGKGAMIAAGAIVVVSVPDCHLLKRSGEMVPIDPARSVQRMRRAISSTERKV